MVKTIKLDYIAKVEGHASLTIKVENDHVTKCELQAIEGARFFEGLLIGRNFKEAQEIVSRICGICSSAHTIAAVQAIESALNIKVSHQTQLIRELLTIGERIRSHSTHLYFMALPDYLGYESAIKMLPKYKTEINRALSLMKLGNSIISTVGGREIHPLNIQVGGITKLPTQKQIDDVIQQIKQAKPDIIKTANFFSKIKYPNLKRRTEYFSLYEKDKYATTSGNLFSESTLIEPKDYKKHITENLEEYATSKFALKDGKFFTVGAMARINNNHKLLSKDAKKILSKFELPFINPFYNNVCQAIELVHFADYAISLFKKFTLQEEKIPKIKVKEGHGISAVEAPRGTLFHDYHIDKHGIIDYANILTPTVQNLRSMEEDIKWYLPQIIHLKKEKVALEIEKLIRAYDPCFSCSTHFLDVKWE